MREELFMSKKKNLLLVTALSAALLAAAGIGTYSWFTSETSAFGTMESGILEINENNDIEKPMFDGKQFTPSQLQYGEWLSLSNTGDLDAYLEATYSHSVDKASLEEYEVGFMAMKYTVQPGEDVYEESKIELENLFNGTTNERNISTLRAPEGVEVIGNVVDEDAADSGEIVFGEGSEEDFWELKEDEYIDIMVGVKLEDTAGNEYQGATYEAELTVRAKQTDDGAQYE